MRFYDLPDTLDSDIAKYECLVNGYLSDTVSKTQLKAFRVPFGVYEQREDETYMMRIRLPGGAITPFQLRNVAETAKKYTAASLHFTTRQDVQIHDLALKDTVRIMKELKVIGLSTRGGGGNTVRNILASYDAGINENHPFDISPYVSALTTRMIAESDSWTLPRKLKISFSGDSSDTGLATINDLGFIACLNEKGEKGFSVYIAGGMGRKPRAGFLLYEFVHDTEVYNIVKAVKIFFDKHGNRKNKHKARLRFVLEKYGKESFLALYDDEYTRVKKQNYLPLALPGAMVLKKEYLRIPLFLGDLSTENAIQFSNIIEKSGEGMIRVIPSQDLLVTNINLNERDTFKKEFFQLRILNDLPGIVVNASACAGAGTCRLGVCLSRNLLTAIKARLWHYIPDSQKLADISIKISGCPNNCGQHSIADIGFSGFARRCYGRLAPFYEIFTGGTVEKEKTELAEKTGTLSAGAIPEVLYEFLVFICDTRKPVENFREFLQRAGKAKLKELLRKYSYIPHYEENEDFYYDWFDDEPFSLATRSTGECSAGLFDLIDVDLDMADDALKRANTAKDHEEVQKLLCESLLSSMRALMITKGLEPENEQDVVQLFHRFFIGKHIDKKWEEVIHCYMHNLEISFEQANGFFTVIKQLYLSMDDSLKLPDVKEETMHKDQEPVMQSHDFRGVACPMNFVKIKLVLETIQPGEKIKVLLDDGEPIDNVPPSVKAEGHIIEQKIQINEYWSVIIMKGEVEK